MAFDIDVFRSEIYRRKGPLRTNKFKVVITPPPGLLNGGFQGIARSIEYWCESVNLPGYLLGAHDVRRWTYGPVEKRVLTPSFTDLQCTFINDNEFSIWDFFHSWQQLIIPHQRRRDGNETNNGINTIVTNNPTRYVYEIEYKVNYVTDLRIIVYDESGKPSIEIVCTEAFPAQIPDTPFSWADTNNIMRFPVVFHYLDWYQENVSEF